MKKRWLLIALAAVSAAVLLLVGVTSAYFTDIEVRENNITIGKVSVELKEEPFEKNKTYDVVPGSRVEKAPRLKNDGTKDEFVFIKVTVPTENVTLLREADGNGEKKGTPLGLTGTQQLFKILTTDNGADNIKAVAPQTGKDIEFTYHSSETGGAAAEGWTLIKSEPKSKTESGVTKTWDEYIFGYNKKMVPGDETISLFDAVQLKSFIDGETDGEKEIGVSCYGIQSDYLKPDETGGIDLDATLLSDNTLSAIYTIVDNKVKG